MASSVTVSASDGTDLSSIIWTGMTPWLYTSQQVYVEIPGGTGQGVIYTRGLDNAVCTLTGRAPRTAEAQVMALAGLRATVSDGTVSKTAVLGTPAVTGQSWLMAWIEFTVSVRAEAGQ